MKVIVTCGPSFEPIDRVRRLTNFSTGQLGVLLSEELARAGFEVMCFKGVGATFRDPSPPCRESPFETNDDLLALLEQASLGSPIGAVFHAAALCDYKVQSIEDAEGRALHSAKIPTRAGLLTLTLEPATKVISRLRGLFPSSWLVGWKYELTGTPAECQARAQRQLQENGTDICVLNGEAAGPGFLVMEGAEPLRPFGDKPALVHFLTTWLQEKAVREPRV